MILVTGVTGKLGSLIAEELLKHVAPGEIAASTRDVGKARTLAERGVRVRHGDYADPASLRDAFEGGTQLLLVSSNAAATGGDPLAQHRAAIEAAKAAGVRRVVYTSHMGASATSGFPPMHTHAATEAMLFGSGLDWTALRNGFYASTVPMLLGDAAHSAVLSAPEDGKVAWTAHADLAAAAAVILIDAGRFEGPTPPLTAGEALDLCEVAAILSDMLGRPVERRVVSEAEQQDALTEAGLPPGAIATTLAIYRVARAGEFSTVDPTLATLLGRRPATVRDLLAVL